MFEDLFFNVDNIDFYNNNVDYIDYLDNIHFKYI